MDGPAILLVDDEADSCRNLADIFTDLGYRVDMAHDGVAALELVRRQRFDVALLDLMMPGMDGATLYAEIKKLRASMVVMLVTAYPNSPRVEQATAAGAWQVVPKPVELSSLLNLVDEALSQPLILLVDDDTDLCANLWDVLHEHGYRTCLAHDGRSAAERLQEERFRVILVDLKLPDMSGAEVCQLVRQSNPEAKVIIVTGWRQQMQPAVELAISGTASMVLDKPLDVPSLLAVLRQSI